MSVYTLLYSDFEPSSLKIIERIQQSESHDIIYLISVDDPKIRRDIMKSNKIKITMIPSLIEITESDTIHIHIGELECLMKLFPPVDDLQEPINIHTPINMEDKVSIIKPKNTLDLAAQMEKERESN